MHFWIYEEIQFKNIIQNWIFSWIQFKKIFKTGFFLGFNSKKYSFNTKKEYLPWLTGQGKSILYEHIITLQPPLTSLRDCKWYLGSISSLQGCSLPDYSKSAWLAKQEQLHVHLRCLRCCHGLDCRSPLLRTQKY